MPRNVLASLLVCALLSAGCFSLARESSRTNPSNPVSQLLGGQWATTQSLPGFGSGSVQEACTDFTWSVTEFSGSSGSGTFSATCAGVLKINGSARGTISGTAVNWTASATAGGPGVPSACTISLSGTAVFDGNQIRIPYSGTTCLGPVSGTEFLGKR